MAFDVPLDPAASGTPATYWRIASVHLDHQAGQANLWLHGWQDHAARLAGHAPRASVQMVLHAADLDLHQATTQALYAALKSRALADALLPEHALERPIAVHGPAILARAVDC